ncbi:MAG: hypothetical protein A2Z72_01830 [Omnitrophica bacterium RBG_13_46_9]|nr:MAG: hypothetical protein A2Z72_01830 [Omnitrophica bacterium RBG_13_46_9]
MKLHALTGVGFFLSLWRSDPPCFRVAKSRRTKIAAENLAEAEFYSMSIPTIAGEELREGGLNMDLSRLKETDLFGRFYLKLSPDPGIDTYYKTIDALRPLLTSKEWDESVTGYYINVARENHSARLSYFTKAPDSVQECVRAFCSGHNIKNTWEPELPRGVRISELYGGEELRFRRYLYLYNLIGLDIIKADLLNARCLIAAFRLQFMPLRQPYKSYFEKTFRIQSEAYNSLSEQEKEQFWLDLSNWPDPNQVDWAHMMVNMILPGDWPQSLYKAYLFSQKPPLDMTEINKMIMHLGFQIPAAWHPLR